MNEPVKRIVSPDEQLRILKLILNLRKLGDCDASEKLRNRVRKALQDTKDDETTFSVIDHFCRSAEKTQSKLDGTLDKRRAEKRARMEARTHRASQYVDIQAEVGEGDSDEDEEDS